jgi:hypothetical protein
MPASSRAATRRRADLILRTCDVDLLAPAIDGQAEREQASRAGISNFDWGQQMPSNVLAHEIGRRLQHCAGFAECQRLKPTGRMGVRTEPRETAKVSVR